MAKIVYDYPKSSCDCYRCTEVLYKDTTDGTPSNMSVTNCKTPDMLDCYNVLPPFLDAIGPQKQSGYKYLNPNVYQSKFATDFNAVTCANNQGCPKLQFASGDPRLVSASHSGQMLTLDRPPIETQPLLSSLSTDKTLDNYGQNYRTYNDISAGSIMYYVDKARVEPFSNPVFVTPAKTVGYLYQDPMGSITPEYNRTPLKCANHINTMRNNYMGGLSWIEDSQEQREDLISKQMFRINQERWDPRWETKSTMQM